ncbi:hypothetical protein [Vulgatibacter sp.]|uniref:hypothetical protein n=1 Tax=Vulgatibacter sp. TaxID=1971226 RepID=UPI003565EDBD
MADKLHDDEVRALDRPAAAAGREAMVPSSYAEKAMSSLLRLHEDLVEEKERRIDLYRRLMEREQSLAEMRAYVKLLEVELARRGFDPTAYAIDPASAPPSAEQRHAVATAAAAAASTAPRAEPPPPAPPQQPPAASRPPSAPQPAPASSRGEPHGAPVLAWTPASGKGWEIR